MRHRKHRFQLGRKKEHREALMANLAVALLTHGRIRTTLAKAKALRPFIEKIVTLAKKAKAASPERALYLRRLAISRVRDRAAIRQLFDERVDEFTERAGGYTRIYKLQRRIGDGAELALIEFVAGSDEGYPKRRKSGGKAKKTANADKESAPAATETAVAEPTEEKAEDAETAEETKASAPAEEPSDASAEADDSDTKEKPQNG
jgi:large subunit ribosomal protein L17